MKVKMTVSVPGVVKPLLDDFLALLDERSPGLVGGFYLQGSIALDAFDERSSDVDFVAFLNRAWTTRDLAALQSIHVLLRRTYPRWPVEGLFVEWPGGTDVDRVVTPYLSQRGGKIKPDRNFELNDVTWWLLKNRGISLRGKEAQSLGYEVDWPVLLAGLHRNQNTYWAGYTRRPLRVAQLFTDWGIEWVVLGVLRQLYTFRENDITSKIGAGRYALQHLPSRWRNLIREAIVLREGARSDIYKSKFWRGIEAFRFLRYVRKLCNEIAETQRPMS